MIMFAEKIKLNHYSNYKIGGPASYFFEAKNIKDIVGAVEKWRSMNGKQIFILGGGTNLLINDKGFSGLVLKPSIDILEKDDDKIRVGAGVLMSDLLNFAAKNGLAGLEWAGGLPGTVGGAIRGNAGAFGGETKDSVLEVASVDISSRESKLVKRNNKECKFGYRDSFFKKNDGKEIIVEAIFSFQKGEPAAITQAIMEKVNYRKTRHPMEYPNIGSIFKNVDLKTIAKNKQEFFLHVVKSDPFPVVPTAYLITEAGLKGVSFGGAMISPKHPNFIVNSLNASSDDVRHLIKLVKVTVKKKFGIQLEEEIIYV